MQSVIAEPTGPPPVARCTPVPAMPPMNATTVPEVGATEFAITSSSAPTTCGSAADRAAKTNRLTPSATRALIQTGKPSAPPAMNTAPSATKAARASADQNRIWRRDHRSMNTPANGPTSEYGRYSTANEIAAAAGFGNEAAL